MAGPKTSLSAESSPVGDGLPSVPWERVERFIGQLTHDVRNGLNALELQLTFLGEISTDPEAADEIKRMRATLGNVTKHLQTLRTTVGTTTPYPLEYPVGEFFEDLRERFAKLHPGFDTKVVWEVEIDPVTLLSVDPEVTINALLELLTNALHFAPGDGLPIRVRVSAAEDSTVFSLLEPQPNQPKVGAEDWGRTPFLSTRRGAYGLGLFRVRRSLESEGSTMEMEYSSEHHTLTTNVTLPGAPARQP